MRAWIGLALLAGSWSLGLGYYEPANFPAWAIVLAAGVAMLCASLSLALWEKAETGDAAEDAIDAEASRAPRETSAASPARSETLLEAAGIGGDHFPTMLGARIATLLLLLPAVWFAPWPYRAAPLCLAAGVGLLLLRADSTRLRRFGPGAIVAGLVLLVQAVALCGYMMFTGRSHDMPWPAPPMLAGVARLLGMEAVADGPYVVLHSLRQPHRFAVTWDLLLDPATLCFFFGGLAMLAAMAWTDRPAGQRLRPWRFAAGALAIAILVWLPVRVGLMMALYLQRAMQSDPDLPLHAMNQFLSSWVLLALLAVPVLLAWRFVRFKEGVQGSRIKAQDPPKGKTKSADPIALSPTPPRRRSPLPSLYLRAALVLLAAALAALGLQWQPSGERKQGRVTWIERHSTWSPTMPNGLGAGGTYDTEHFGGDDVDSSGYNYAAIYRYLGQFYGQGRIEEKGRIDDDSLSHCDVLVIKIPKVRYSAAEIAAVVQFVRGGGGLLLIGDHTNYDRSASHLNDITRHFGFTYRHDQLYSQEPAPDAQRYTARRVPHPAVQHVKGMDFAGPCSIEPGGSAGRAALQSGCLWSVAANYHMDNYMPYAQHAPEMRYGPFVQLWAAQYGKGRVLAFTDSTIFSNFCVHQPGKAESMLNMIEWLNHAPPATPLQGPLLALSMLPLGAAIWLVRRRTSRQFTFWPLFLAAATCGWALGSEGVAALHRAGLPLPRPAEGRALPRVVIDRTTSQVPLAKGAYNENAAGRGYGLLEQWIPRLGYSTVREQDAEAFSGDALMVVCPSRLPDQDFRERLVEYVAQGGKLLVLDAPAEGRPSTANALLRPFGLSVNCEQAWQGDLQLLGRSLAVRVDQAFEISGGDPLASLGGQRTVCASARYGKGLVMAVGFGNLFNDARMGSEWALKPDEQELARYRVLFALLRSLVEDRPLVVPAPASATPEKPDAKPLSTTQDRRSAQR